MVDATGERADAERRLREFGAKVRPVDLRPVGSTELSVMLASVGSNVWTNAKLTAIQPPEVVVATRDREMPAKEVVLRCSGRQAGNAAFRMSVVDAEPLEGDGYRLKLRVEAIASDFDA